MAKPDISIEALRRKLLVLGDLLHDPGATANEKATAEMLKKRLEAQLARAGVPAGDWSDVIFRLGRTIKGIKSPDAPAAPGGDWTGTVFRMGKAFRRGVRKWRGP